MKYRFLDKTSLNFQTNNIHLGWLAKLTYPYHRSKYNNQDATYFVNPTANTNRFLRYNYLGFEVVFY